MTTKTDKKIIIHSSHKPSLTASHYTINVTQKLAKEGQIEDSKATFESNQVDFIVEGPKFSLESNMLHHVYPANGAKGEYMADLPAIVFNRSTLPWERFPFNETEVSEKSWLCLLLVNEEEKKQLQEKKITIDSTTTVLGLNADEKERFGGIETSCLDLNKALLELLPTKEELKYLSYARTGAEEGGEEKAVLLCNRLPQKGSYNTVYLLSLENLKEDYATAENLIVPCLHSWVFYCQDDNNYLVSAISKTKIDTAIVKDIAPLDGLTGELIHGSQKFRDLLSALKYKKNEIEDILSKTKIKGGTFHGMLHHLPGKLKSFNYPIANDKLESIDETTRKKIQQGAVLLKDNLGLKWYRGPFQAAKVNATMPLVTPKQPSAILPKNRIFESATDLMKGNDYSYAVAWELGRMTALNDKVFHQPFMDWKNEVCAARLHESTLQETNASHLPIIHKLDKEKAYPKPVLDKVNNWKLLKGLPLSYLVPSISMIPLESIRYFCLDKLWINYFINGAYSIGHSVLDLEDRICELYQKNDLYGFVINSRVVSLWPDFEVEATYGGQPVRNLVRNDLSPNIQLFIFEGMIDKLTFHLHPGKTHSGFLYEDGKFTKNGENVPFRKNLKNKGVLDINTLADTKNIAEFGEMLLEAVPHVVFDFIAE